MNTETIQKIALGGGCHWCTEAVFQSLIGVKKVEQGFVTSIDEHDAFSEAVVVHFDPTLISLDLLIEIHLHTHKSTSAHAMRNTYRSAIYTFTDKQMSASNNCLSRLQSAFNKPLLTEVHAFSKFRASREAIQNYYQKNPKKPFCERYIYPKLSLICDKYSERMHPEFLSVAVTP